MLLQFAKKQQLANKIAVVLQKKCCKTYYLSRCKNTSKYLFFNKLQYIYVVKYV